MTITRARQIIRIPASYNAARAAEAARAFCRNLVVGAPLRYSVACRTLIEAA